MALMNYGSWQFKALNHDSLWQLAVMYLNNDYIIKTGEFAFSSSWEVLI